MKTLVVLLAVLCLAAPSIGASSSLAAEAAVAPGAPPATAPAPGNPEDPIAAQLFPPEIVMQYQQHIGITDAQRRSITGAISALQSQVLEMQWNMQAEQQKLVELLGQSPVNVAAALAQADRLMEIEHRVKHAHLAALIRIKNVLTREQQTRLRAMTAHEDANK